ncbi:hypothetical protein RA2_04438 [Roseovarius sp. A-2]|uniref:hypothetical protein n=1 Tax=Roseovarius sp. A-2 TaxID=1570360 RepID=UPI0009CEC575|nr:hypothetical protein [Roseovarius sp. A-2]GAW37355.1 hypothetical protein RA2_04438 [Roseovarius sp. A-2]
MLNASSENTPTFSRRGVLAILGGVGAAGLLPTQRARAGGTSTSALAFDGDALVAGTSPAPGAPLPEGEPVSALVSTHGAPERLYAALSSGLWASADGGVAWENRSDLHAQALAVDPADPNHIAAISATKLQHSRDGGTIWVTLAAI